MKFFFKFTTNFGVTNVHFIPKESAENMSPDIHEKISGAVVDQALRSRHDPVAILKLLV